MSHANMNERDVERANIYHAYLAGFRDGVTGRAYRMDKTHRLWPTYAKGLDLGRKRCADAAREASIEAGGYRPSPFRAESP